MAAIQDPELVKLCAQLASHLSISLASARRQVDQAAAKVGRKDIEARRKIAKELIEDVLQSAEPAGATLDQLLIASDSDIHFMLED